MMAHATQDSRHLPPLANLVFSAPLHRLWWTSLASHAADEMTSEVELSTPQIENVTPGAAHNLPTSRLDEPHI